MVPVVVSMVKENKVAKHLPKQNRCENYDVSGWFHQVLFILVISK